MSPRALVIQALQILGLAAVIGGSIAALGWIDATDRRVESASLETYCNGVATWKAEAARGVPEGHRTGHPDYRDTAAEQCPGMRPAEPANSSGTLTGSQRQLAHQ